MIRQIIGALRGKRVWRHLRREYGINGDQAVLVMTDSDPEWNGVFIKYSERFCERKSLKSTVILATEDAGIKTDASICTVHRIKKDDIELLVKYYLLIRFSDNIVFCTKDETIVNRCSYIFSHSDITVPEYVCYGMYKLRGVPDV